MTYSQTEQAIFIALHRLRTGRVDEDDRKQVKADRQNTHDIGYDGVELDNRAGQHT